MSDKVQRSNTKCKFEKERLGLNAYPKLMKGFQRSKEKIVDAPLVTNLLKSVRECPLVEFLQDVGFRRMNKKDNHVIMKIALSEIEDRFEVIVGTLVPSGNGRVGDARDRKVLRHVCNKQINARISSRNCGRVTITGGSNLYS